MTNQPTNHTAWPGLDDAAVEANIEENLAALYVLDDADLERIAMRGFFRLRAELQIAMGDMSLWHPGIGEQSTYPVDPTEQEVGELVDFIRHLLEAVHGICARCGEPISAAQKYEYVPPRWRPGNLAAAAGALWRYRRTPVDAVVIAWHTATGRYGGRLLHVGAWRCPR